MLAESSFLVRLLRKGRQFFLSEIRPRVCYSRLQKGASLWYGNHASRIVAMQLTSSIEGTVISLSFQDAKFSPYEGPLTA